MAADGAAGQRHRPGYRKAHPVAAHQLAARIVAAAHHVAAVRIAAVWLTDARQAAALPVAVRLADARIAAVLPVAARIVAARIVAALPVAAHPPGAVRHLANCKATYLYHSGLMARTRRFASCTVGV